MLIIFFLFLQLTKKDKKAKPAGRCPISNSELLTQDISMCWIYLKLSKFAITFIFLMDYTKMHRFTIQGSKQWWSAITFLFKSCAVFMTYCGTLSQSWIAPWLHCPNKERWRVLLMLLYCTPTLFHFKGLLYLVHFPPNVPFFLSLFWFPVLTDPDWTGSISSSSRSSPMIK